MPAIRLPIFDQSLFQEPVEKQVRTLADFIMRYRRELEWLLNGMLDEDNGLSGTVNINTLVTNNFVTETLYASGKAYISDLTVDQIDTSDFVPRYLANNKTPVGYWRGYDQYIDFIEAIYAGDTDPVDYTGYQQWNSYPVSPVLSEDYQNQAIVSSASRPVLYASTRPMYRQSGYLQPMTDAVTVMYDLENGVWKHLATTIGWAYLIYNPTFSEANTNVYTNAALTTAYFAKTTTSEQDNAAPAGPTEVQVTDRVGEPLFWLDAEHIGGGFTYEDTGLPIMRYVYNGPDGVGVVKLRIYHEIDPETGYANPKIVWGAGSGSVEHPDWGKAFMYKDADGLVFEYLSSTGALRQIRLGEDGTYQIGNTGSVGIRNIAISATAPASPQMNDLWIDTDA